jgi:hypothetical protein
MPHRITLSLTTKQAGTPGRNWLTFISRWAGQTISSQAAQQR